MSGRPYCQIRSRETQANFHRLSLVRRMAAFAVVSVWRRIRQRAWRRNLSTMQHKNGKTKEIWGRQFSVVKHGLDEHEVFSFVGTLIDRNNEYAEKLEHLDSLVKLAENTIVEADQEAERIRTQVLERADEEARAVLARAGEDAKAQAQVILSDAEEAAAVQAAKILAEAEREAQEKIAAAQQLSRDIISSAEEEAKQEAGAIRQQAVAHVQDSRQRARAFLAKSREVAVSDIRAKFEAAFQEMLSAWSNADADFEEEQSPAADYTMDAPPADTSSPDAESPAQVGGIGGAIRSALFGGKRT
jgi:vacuolar-type H+-ATPase subunit H